MIWPLFPQNLLTFSPSTLNPRVAAYVHGELSRSQSQAPDTPAAPFAERRYGKPPSTTTVPDRSLRSFVRSGAAARAPSYLDVSVRVGAPNVTGEVRSRGWIVPVPALRSSRSPQPGALPCPEEGSSIAIMSPAAACAVPCGRASGARVRARTALSC
jgi:hypothetical protein